MKTQVNIEDPRMLPAGWWDTAKKTLILPDEVPSNRGWTAPVVITGMDTEATVHRFTGRAGCDWRTLTGKARELVRETLAAQVRRYFAS